MSLTGEMSRPSTGLATRRRAPGSQLHISLPASMQTGAEMEKPEILRQIEDGLQDFSSREFQKRVWIQGRGPEVSSYEELMCRLFDDLDVRNLAASNWSGFGLTVEQKARLTRFLGSLATFDAEIPQLPDPCFVFEKLDMSNVRIVAKETLDALRISRSGS